MQRAVCRAQFGLDSSELAQACIDGMLEVLLLPCRTGTGGVDAGVVRSKQMVLEFLRTKHLFTEKEVLWPLIVASSDVEYGSRFRTGFCTRGCHWIPRMFA
jgi:hypothetical protein